MKIKRSMKDGTTHVESHRSFIDLQAKGPYRLWRHHHGYIKNQKGVLVLDTVDYQLHSVLAIPSGHD
ncbi:hypothetical protein ACFOET_18105 [Parapedobacter deserti]|uniref:Uncharacterized protein n=1 Tax=Parapedobacter deserti TaxID=1912957 RepID=A0ABV7JN48_9SPHI